MIQFDDRYRGRRVLLTGHTGFKGSWLALWLRQLGAEVTGIALDPDGPGNHWDLLGIEMADHRHDIRDAGRIQEIVRMTRPEIVFHLAAQALVRRSYREPLATWSTNVMGTANVLEACRNVDSVKAIVVVTTDKVYANREWPWGYRENDRLGGHDPYSASKAACEVLLASYRKAFFNESGSLLVGSARAGNVIGGGDWSADRLIPDLVRAVARKEPLVIRSPTATRPWQHVLECLSGYLLLGQNLLGGRQAFADAWNFGPNHSDNCPVEEVLVRLQSYWPQLAWQVDRDPQPHEAKLLYLDHSKARAQLGWKPVWNLDQALPATARWYRQLHEHKIVESQSQLESYVAAGQRAGVAWITA